MGHCFTGDNQPRPANSRSPTLAASHSGSYWALLGGLLHGEPQLVGLREAASSFAVQLEFVEILEDTKGYEAAFESMGRAGVHALLVPTSPRFFRDRRPIMELAAKQRIPAIYELASVALVSPGCLPAQVELSSRSATTTRNRNGDFGLPATTSFSPTPSGTVPT